MIKSSKRLIVGLSLLILVSLACNVPILNQIQSSLAPADDTGSSLAPADDTGSSSSSDGTNPDSTAPSNTDGAELTFIPGATFLMGSSTSDLLADEDELPQHEVTLGEFYIYTYEVTNQMYAACVDAGGCMSVETFDVGPTSHFEDPDFEDFPVVGVDWVMARDYCSWAGSRLPTEAEWELASRGPESLLYPWGEEEPTCDYVNMGGCLIPPDTQQIGHYLMGNSPDGVWDMSGNVWEWVHDWYADDYYAQSPADNPIGPLEPQDPDKPLRVIRGGGLYSEPVRMRSASRLGINPYRPFDDVGFRCVVGEGLALPAAYEPGEDRHERVPPGRADGGDRAEDDPDDEIVYWSGGAIGPCPDIEGQIRLTFAAGSRPPAAGIAAFFRFADAPFDIPCDYNEALGVATCEGLAPPGYLDPPPTFPMDICFATPEWERCVFGIRVLKPTDCGGDSDSLEVELRPLCTPDGDGGRIPSFQVIYTPVTAPFEGASTVEGPLTCENIPFPGAYSCHDLPGDPLDELIVDVAFADGRIITDRVLHLECGRPERRYEIETECIDIDGSLTPVITFEFWGSGEDLSFATANSSLLTCLYDWGIEKYHCSPLPGTFPSDLEFVASFTDATTWTTIVPFPDCLETLDFTTPWNLVLGRCTIPPGLAAQYDLFIDTHVEGVADADWIGWSLDGVVPPQNCLPDQPPEGRWDCSFAVADYTGVSIEFCAQWPDNPAGHCATFTDIDDYLPPDCTTPDDHGDGDNGGGDPGSGYCIVESSGSCGSNPCRPSCEPSGPNESCIPCTMP